MQNKGWLQEPDETQINRQRAIADMLMQESQRPIDTNRSSGRYITPVSNTEVISKIINGLMAGYSMNKADESAKNLSERRNMDYKSTMENYASALRGTPERSVQNLSPLVGNNPSSPMMKTTPAIPGSQEAAMDVLGQSNHPMIRETYLKLLAQQLKDKEGFTLRPGDTRFTGEGKQISAIPASLDINKAYFTPVQSVNGVYAFDSRTGHAELARDASGRQIIGASNDPELQQRLSQAKAMGKADSTRMVEANKDTRRNDQLLASVNQARTLLNANPTQSGVGAAVDSALRLFGGTSDSAKAASQLETLSGWMTSNVPRMEGPQSNLDVQNYQIMAAKVGDRTVPVAERMAALDVLEKLQMKYQDINSQPLQKLGAPPPPRSGITAQRPSSPLPPGGIPNQIRVRKYNPKTEAIE